MNQNFLLAEDVVCEGALNIGFMSLRGSGPVFIQMTTGGQVMNTISNVIERKLEQGLLCHPRVV